ncbi:hypothetical protein BDV12DRAFT_193524 [Aspergillus spectabilis]
MAPTTRSRSRTESLQLATMPPPPQQPIVKNLTQNKQLPAPTNQGGQSLSNYAGESQEKVKELATSAVASIYYDLNQVCLLRIKVIWTPNEDNTTHYRFQFKESAELLDRVFGKRLDPAAYRSSDPRGTLDRLEYFIKKCGFKMLSICMLAEGFRRACREFKHRVLWKEFMLGIWENRRSIDVFACSRDLDWRGPLLKYAQLGIKELDKELEPAPKIFQGNSQIHIDEPMMGPLKWEGKGGMVDPTLRRVPEGAEDDDDGYCALCGSPDICACELDFLPCSMVELKGAILGEFIGEICPLTMGHGPGSLRILARSCNLSAKFVPRTIGNRIMMTIEALRDISAFEDITINYG